MPQVKQMTQQELKILQEEKAHLFSQNDKKFSKEQIAELVILLQGAGDIYLSKFGTYKPSVYQEFNENKVRSSFAIISSLIEYHTKNGVLTDGQILLAKKLIRNASKLT